MLTLAEAKKYCRVDGEDSNEVLARMIETAAAHIENYLGLKYELGHVPAPVKSACALLIGHLFDNRLSHSETELFTDPAFFHLLNPYRVMDA